MANPPGLLEVAREKMRVRHLAFRTEQAYMQWIRRYVHFHYAELSLSFDSVAALDDALDGMALALHELPRPALFLAGKAFVKYRRAGGSKANVLADFFVGAHAAVMGCGIVTRDTRRYKNYFPRVVLIAPE